MKCADPVLCYIPERGSKVYRNFSLATAVLKRAHQQVFDCGKCIVCRKKRAYELACKCVLHASLYKQNCFLTLTYDEKLETYHNNFYYTDIQKFKKNFRQHVNSAEYSHLKTRKLKRRRNSKWLYKKIEIFNVHEYGKNGKKHWHLIVFNHDFLDKIPHGKYYTSEELSKIWPYGFNVVGDVTEASAMYQAQYMEKDFKYGTTANLKRSHSKHSGIGRSYFNRHYSDILRLGWIPINGRKLPLPRSFEKIAHKHYAHYYEPRYFHDTREAKARYKPFKSGQAKRDMADLYIQYAGRKQERIIELENAWKEILDQHLTTKEDPDFMKAGSNIIYDLKHKSLGESF